MFINGRYIKLSEVASVVPIGNMSRCRVIFISGGTEVFAGYQEIMEALAKE